MLFGAPRVVSGRKRQPVPRPRASRPGSTCGRELSVLGNFPFGSVKRGKNRGSGSRIFFNYRLLSLLNWRTCFQLCKSLTQLCFVRIRRELGGPKAQNMKARCKRRAQRDASPLVMRYKLKRALKVRNIFGSTPLFQSFIVNLIVIQGQAASTARRVAPGYEI